MGSNTVATLLSSLLRPDKKAKQKNPRENNRRHSAPAPDWCEISEIITPSTNEKPAENILKSKQKLKGKYSSQQNLSVTKRQKNTKEKQSNNKTKRASAGFPSWFCVSGNTDTLDRTPIPFQNKEDANVNKRNAKNIYRPSSNFADFIRIEPKKTSQEPTNSYSPPNIAKLAGRTQNSSTVSEELTQTKNPLDKEGRRERSPGVKYRIDGTLEKPYVFPAGLTFGPEGRKVKLRRTTASQSSDNSISSCFPFQKTVKVDVHRSSNEDILKEYIYEDCVPDHSVFDARKAFYLKFDSDLSQYEEHNDVAAVGLQDKENMQIPNLPNSNNNSIVHTRNSKWHVKTDRSRNRYSMPPKNDEFIYMGSFENVNICDHLEMENDVFQSDFEILRIDESCKRDSRKSKHKNRYSLPPKSDEFVYMGSFEHVNQLLHNNIKMGRLCDVSFPSVSMAENLEIASGSEGHDRSSNLSEQDKKYNGSMTGSEFWGNSFVMDVGSMGNDHQSGEQLNKQDLDVSVTSLRWEGKRHSMPELVIPSNLTIAKNSSEDNADYQEEDEDNSDSFDVSFSFGRARSSTEVNSFFQRHGRSSCMPGNSRRIPPPLAIFNPPFSAIVNTDACNKHFTKSTHEAETKCFSIPPPPTSTPPKEKMEDFKSNLKKMACHKGSQTDLTVDMDSLSMEDRDASLKREATMAILPDGPHSASPSDDTHKKIYNFDSSKQGETDDTSIPGKDKTVINSSVSQLSKIPPNVLDTPNESKEAFTDKDNNIFNKETDIKNKTRFTQLFSNAPHHIGNLNIVRNEPPESSISSVSQQHQRPYMLNLTKPLNLSELNTSGGSSPRTVSTSMNTWEPRPKQQLHTSCKDSGWKPVPHPRKLRSSLCDTSSTQQISSQVNNSQQATTERRAPPVPKKRHSLSHSISLSAGQDFCSKPDSSSQNWATHPGKTLVGQKLFRAQSHSGCSTLERNTTTGLSNLPITGRAGNNESHYEEDDNVYEEIDFPKRLSDQSRTGTDSTKNRPENERFYDTNKIYRKNNLIDLENKDTTNLEETPKQLETLQLSSSPRSKRRLDSLSELSNKPFSSKYRLQYFGLASSVDNIVDAFDRCRWEGDYHIYDDIDDNDSVADDEMSLSNDEEDMEDKEFKLRRCVSADELLRSGSILDRSMIMAKRRRKRLSDRNARAKLAVSQEYKESVGAKDSANLDVNCLTTNILPKSYYKKKKTTSSERIYKHRANHTDSGHDSEIVSPCTSPDSKRHVSNVTSLETEHSSHDVMDSCVPPHGTLPKKPWEIRLRNIQCQRKSRSKDNLLSSGYR